MSVLLVVVCVVVEGAVVAVVAELPFVVTQLLPVQLVTELPSILTQALPAHTLVVCPVLTLGVGVVPVPIETLELDALFPLEEDESVVQTVPTQTLAVVLVDVCPNACRFMPIQPIKSQNDHFKFDFTAITSQISAKLRFIG
ncbi:MAG: hypothetical protein PHP00_02070 [Thiotrichaceae bacterium]|nr:hypothetical protein [Thiotrichaceae bacterium]